MEYIKLQICCIVVVLYLGILYYVNKFRKENKRAFALFDLIILVALISLVFDGITAYTVNNLDTVNDVANKIYHLIFLISLDSIIFLMFVYMLKTTGLLPKKIITKCLAYIPFVVCLTIVIAFIHQLEFKVGNISNYSMGISAYTCYAMVFIYTILTIIVFFKSWKYIESRKRIYITTYLFTLVVITIIQMIFVDILLTSLAVAVLVLGIYINHESSSVKKMTEYQNEMVSGFATLIENKDSSTGGHVNRTCKYVELLARELRNKGLYKNILTGDYLNNLIKAAPMHDIGKVSIPDDILQKPGRLTSDEYDIMKQHSEKGREIIKNTFGHLDDKEYLDIAYNIALHHHEKWNGNGYPHGLKGNDIPLCARIMAIADVFDAVSEKRCYREAMPIDECFKVIENGRGTDFEPLLVDIFLSIRKDIENAYYSK